MDLSILIPTIKKHESFYNKLRLELSEQITPYIERVEVLSDMSESDSIGAKRNRLLNWATGKYVAFIDADDRVAPHYIDRLMEGIEQDVDCCSLIGVITVNGVSPAFFEHSLKYKEYRTNEHAKWGNGDIKYERFPNHLSCIRADVAKQFKFPETNFGEDTDWATQIHNSGLLKIEHPIFSPIYYYDYIPK